MLTSGLCAGFLLVLANLPKDRSLSSPKPSGCKSMAYNLPKDQSNVSANMFKGRGHVCACMWSVCLYVVCVPVRVSVWGSAEGAECGSSLALEGERSAEKSQPRPHVCEARATCGDAAAGAG